MDDIKYLREQERLRIEEVRRNHPEGADRQFATEREYACYAEGLARGLGWAAWHLERLRESQIGKR